jgi:hypothetical protein
MEQLAAKDPSWAAKCNLIFCLVHGATRAAWCASCTKTTEALGVRALTFGTGGGMGSRQLEPELHAQQQQQQQQQPQPHAQGGGGGCGSSASGGAFPGSASGVMVHDDGTIDGAIPGPVFVVGHLATPGWLAVMAGPLLGSRGVLEGMSGWNAAGKLLAPSQFGSSGGATIISLHKSFADQEDDAAPSSTTPATLIGDWLGWGGRDG